MRSAYIYIGLILHCWTSTNNDIPQADVYPISSFSQEIYVDKCRPSHRSLPRSTMDTYSTRRRRAGYLLSDLSNLRGPARAGSIEVQCEKSFLTSPTDGCAAIHTVLQASDVIHTDTLPILSPRPGKGKGEVEGDIYNVTSVWVSAAVWVWRNLPYVSIVSGDPIGRR